MAEVILGSYRLEVPTGFGPRVIGLRRDDDPEILATDVDATIEHSGGTYAFRGGHRLWASPEVPEFTYASEDNPCDVEIDGDGAVARSGVDDAGFTKEIGVSLDSDSIRVDHTLTREPGAVDGMAAWAITQLPLDGVALVPLTGSDTGPLPDRRLVLWPYTSPADERLRFTEQGVEIAALPGDPVKLGVGPQRPRLGYLRDGQLFVKEFVTTSPGETPDLGAGSQVYVGQGFCELETVGGLSKGTVATVSERWTIRACVDIADAWGILTGESTWAT